MKPWKVPRIWDGGECFILAGGPSVPRQFGVPEETIQFVMSGASTPRLYSDYFKPLHSKHVIGVNNAYMIGTWMDFLFFGDNSWYLVHRYRLAEWPKIKVTCNPRFSESRSRYAGVKYLAKDSNHRHGISPRNGYVSWNSNSGAAAISLAAHLGVKRITLLGFDMCLDDGGISHWHGYHRDKMQGVDRKKAKVKPPPFTRHLKGFPAIAQNAKNMGIEILNASPISKIKEFRKVNIKDLV